MPKNHVNRISFAMISKCIDPRIIVSNALQSNVTLTYALFGLRFEKSFSTPKTLITFTFNHYSHLSRIIIFQKFLKNSSKHRIIFPNKLMHFKIISNNIRSTWFLAWPTFSMNSSKIWTVSIILVEPRKNPQIIQTEPNWLEATRHDTLSQHSDVYIYMVPQPIAYHNYLTTITTGMFFLNDRFTPTFIYLFIYLD